VLKQEEVECRQVYFWNNLRLTTKKKKLCVRKTTFHFLIIHVIGIEYAQVAGILRGATVCQRHELTKKLMMNTFYFLKLSHFLEASVNKTAIIFIYHCQYQSDDVSFVSHHLLIIIYLILISRYISLALLFAQLITLVTYNLHKQFDIIFVTIIVRLFPK
jgi:hypothetical protein